MNMSFIDFIVSAFGGTALVSIIVLVGRTFIKTKIAKEIEHQYNTRLEDHKTNLSKEVIYFKDKLDNDKESFKALLSKQNEIDIAKAQHKLTTEIEITKIYLSRYSEKQFEIYNALWISLVELKSIMLELWEVRATQDKADKLFQSLYKCSIENEKSALLIELRHYEELRMILNTIKEFYFGKIKLIQSRKQNRLQTQAEEYSIIDGNGELYYRFERYYDQFRDCLRRQIQGVQEQ